MFIPHGKIIHDNLATSYVRVDALIADLCEREFSGVVDLTLHQSAGYVVIVRGSVRAVAEKASEGESAEYIKVTLASLTEKSRRERGSVAVRAYSRETAEAIAGRINAQSLYARLSIEFTDLETMLQKLSREPDREWFVDINTDAGISALVYIRDHAFHLIALRQGLEVQWDALDSAYDPVRKELLYDCKRAAGTFDVYFKDPLSSPPPEQFEVSPVISETAGIPPPSISGEPIAGRNPAPLSSVASDDTLAASVTVDAVTEFPLVASEIRTEADGDDLTEVKRLMGEIAGTIEGAAQAVDRRDGFAMCLRASQLKIADRYPFLDPFASEFEYLGGEIVFVGKAAPDQFVAGLTEALALAVESLAESNAHGERFRGYVKEDLGKLLAHNQTEFESYGLDRAIAEIGRF